MEGFSLGLELPLAGLGQLQFLFHPGEEGLGLAQLGLVLCFVGDLFLHVVDDALQAGDLPLGLAHVLPRALFQRVVLVQAQNLGQDALALARAFGGKGVGFTLLEVRGVDEGLVIELDGFQDAALGLANGGFCQGTPGAFYLIPDEELQHAAAPSSPPYALTAHAVALVLQRELHVHQHLSAAVADEVIVRAGACTAPQGPGDGVEQRAFAVAVGPGKAHHVHAVKAQRRQALSVGEEVAQLQLYRPHCVRSHTLQ